MLKDKLNKINIILASGSPRRQQFFKEMDLHYTIRLKEIEEIYPEPDTRHFSYPPIDTVMEGGRRPGHFNGVCQIVSKLFYMVKPTRAYFGEKDFQQLALIRQMVLDLDLEVEIQGVPIVREPDGLAMSSRNRYLDAVQREQAGALSAALLAGMYAAGEGTAAAVDAARAVLDEVPAIEVDYLEVRDAMLGPAPEVGMGRMLVAGRLGATRLLDNIAIDIGVPSGPGRQAEFDEHELPWRN